MHTKDMAVDNRTDGKVVEDLATPTPDVATAILAGGARRQRNELECPWPIMHGAT